jgi:hypothetical protein
MRNQKIACECCDWRGTTDQLLSARNPFDQTDTIQGCPNCRQVGDFVVACDEPDCWREVTNGTPTPAGYRSTCSKHMPNVAALRRRE